MGAECNGRHTIAANCRQVDNALSRLRFDLTLCSTRRRLHRLHYRKRAPFFVAVIARRHGPFYGIAIVGLGSGPLGVFSSMEMFDDIHFGACG